MTALTGDIRAGATEVIEALASGMDSGKMDEILNHFFKLASELGSITCTLVADSSLRLQSGDVLLHEAPLPRAGTKLRMLCARLAVRCSAWSKQEVSPYGAEVEFVSSLTNQPCRVRFDNTTSSVEIAIEIGERGIANGLPLA